MSRAYRYFISSIIVLLLVSAGIYAVQHNRTLQREQEKLILKNDSLHTLQLQTRIELKHTRAKLDSLLKENTSAKNQ